MSPHERYALVKKSVDRFKLIQLGLTLCTSDSGDGAFTTWEFNFGGFNPLQDPHASSSIQLLESQGMNLWMNYHHGIDPQQFRCLMLSSGLLFNPSMIWIGFHLAYDIAYLLKVLTGTNLPDSMEGFLNLVCCHFGPTIFDIKYLCKECDGLEGEGLETIALLGVQRLAGTSHRAGSDSLFTWRTFKTMRTIFFTGGIEVTKAGILFGIQDN
jgi:CCR4-NOT transcription complex subunit 7/8